MNIYLIPLELHMSRQLLLTTLEALLLPVNGNCGSELIWLQLQYYVT